VGKLSSIISDRDGSITALRTDCTLVGGDSGGPLFDMQGRVIGIHSRINQEITTNIHVPIGTYRETWARLLKGADIGQVWFGVSQADDSSDCKLGRITEKSPAEKAGLKEGDVILKFDNQLVSTYKEMRNILNEKDAGDEVEVEIRRGDKTMALKVTLAKKTDKERR
jgi:serine protease Do